MTAHPKEDAMPVTELNHYFVRANDLEKTRAFYCDVLGFSVMPRPTFPFPGYWLGVNGKIQIHMGPDGIDNAETYYLGTPKHAATDHAGVIDHIAFVCSEPGDFIRRFKERAIEFRPRSFPEFDLYQIFVTDPNGLTIELNFFGLKDIEDWGGEMYSAMPPAPAARA
jgi:catechol 2,3-dioxygenase-like lactoylglutathione lyase family enzyme